MATTGGQAGWNLCGRSAARLAGFDFGCGGRGSHFLGVVPILADLVLEDRTCALPLPKGIGVAGGRACSWHLGERRRQGRGRHRKEAWSATGCIAVSLVARRRVCLGREGGPAMPG